LSLNPAHINVLIIVAHIYFVDSPRLLKTRIPKSAFERFIQQVSITYRTFWIALST
ncbi:hypothetical protein L9F63_023465, partial [Diploptera punctata]